MLQFGLNTSAAIGLAVVALGTYLVVRKRGNHDPREPPLAKQSVPVVGHILGLIYHGNSYLEKLT